MSPTGTLIGPATVWRAAALALVVVMFGAGASAASAAKNVNIVRKAGPPGGEIPKNTHYFTTIQEAVSASSKGDWVLIEPGTYEEEVKVTSAQSGIWIRGMDRNGVIVDGNHKVGNGIEIKKADNVFVENLTVRNFEFGKKELEECPDEECGNEIWWTGGKDSGTIGARGWYGNYLTTYDTGLRGGYGEFAQNEETGSFNHIYASGFADSGFYIGACRECDATVNNALMENNALGYSGSNSSGRLVIENSTFKHNLVGIAPNSETGGDAPPPLDGACDSFKNIEGTWGCQNKTTPTPGGALGAAEYLLTLQGESKALKEKFTTPQEVPPAQPTMPEPCEGVPKNPLCPRGNS